MTLKISASDKIQSLKNHNYRTRHSTDLIRCSFSSLSNSLEIKFIILFISDFLKGFIWKNFFVDNHDRRTRNSIIDLIQCSFSSVTNSLESQDFYLLFSFLKGFY